MERVIQSPLGRIRIKSNADALCELSFTEDPITKNQRPDPVLEQTEAELIEYFAGERKTFTVKLQQQGTPFQEEVWQELQKIPYGSTVSYGELAKRLGSPRASRAVGSANGKNNIAIIVPCHRVITANSKLGGYAYGTDHKAFLLNLEKASYKE